MSESIRQSNLFAAEDYQKVFKAYQFIDYTAYDFDSLKQALINYVQVYYPEDFNDYIESSEFIAIIELLAYLGTSLAFRTEINSRENFIDTAERRESVIRLAQMVNYVPRRNIAAHGLLKIAAVQTDESIVDANGTNISGVSVFWNDPNNPDWFDQFVQVCNSAFSTLNPFGRPTKSGIVGSIPTDLYQLNNVRRLNVVYPFVSSINGQQYPMDICNPDFTPGQTVFERHPNPDNAFNFIYRNDSQGMSSANTGFFLYFKQGSLINVDTNFDFPVPNRVFPVDIQNINQDDVYVQETDENGNVVSQWAKVPALAGENIIYNSIRFSERNIFDVITGANDTVSLRFADGNFGNVPTGLFRTWVRTSANQPLVIRPSDIQGIQLDIPYIGVDEQTYNLRITFTLEQTIGNAAASETDDQIRLRAPEIFSTQSRMVNGSDYNVLPLIYGNQIAKIQAIDRTFSGQSRYIDVADPTGFHKDLIIFGQDGALFRDNQNVLTQVTKNATNSGNIESIIVESIQDLLVNTQVRNFFYDEYLKQFEETIKVYPNGDSDGYSILDLTKPNSDTLLWKTAPAKSKNDTGYFSTSTASGADPTALSSSFSTYNNKDSGTTGSSWLPWGMITAGSVIVMMNPVKPSTLNSASVNNVIQKGLTANVGSNTILSDVGPVELGKEEGNNYVTTKVYPAFRSTLNTAEVAEIVAAVADGISFWIYYDLLTDTWATSSNSTISPDVLPNVAFEYPPAIITSQGTQIYSNWAASPYAGMVYVSIGSDSEAATITYDITARGRVFAFESYRDVRFYWDPDTVVLDNATGLAMQDTITVMPFVNTNNTVDNNMPNDIVPTTSYLDKEVSFNIAGIFVQDDGYRDTAKVKVALVDTDSDGIADDPAGFNRIVSPTDRVVFEYYNNFVSGYQSTRPWVSRWNTEFKDYTGEIYVYFPVDASDSSGGTLYGSPFLTDTHVIDDTNPTVNPYPAAPDSIAESSNSYFYGVSYSAGSLPGASITAKLYTEIDGAVIGAASVGSGGYFYISLDEPLDAGVTIYVTISQTITSFDGNDYVYESEPSTLVVNSFTASTTGGVRVPIVVYMDEADLVFLNSLDQMYFDVNYNSDQVTIANQLSYFYNSEYDTSQIGEFSWITPARGLQNKQTIINNYFANKSFLMYSVSPPGEGVYYALSVAFTNNARYRSHYVVDSIVDKYHFDKNGKVFTQNENIADTYPFYFKWSHYSPIDQRVDPAPTNIIDMIVVTDSYYRDVQQWKNANNSLSAFPAAPTSEELRIQFQDLNNYKMVSDYMVWNSGKFKILFGAQAENELQATFKVVKALSSNISDSEVKTRVIRAIDTYFDIRNWDFGEKFYYTELAAFIHQQLSRVISSVVIVPNNADSQFGNLFEIAANPDELFLSTANVSNVQVVANLTEQNLRV